MILVTVGTNEQPFDRLVQAAAELGGSEPLTVQYGASRVEHGRGRWVDFVSFDELTTLSQEASVVVCHAGVGSIMLARRCGKLPLVVPRRLHLREAVDDHQLPLARRLDSEGLVQLVEDTYELAAAVAARGNGGARPLRNGHGEGANGHASAAELSEEVRLYLHTLVTA